MSLLFFRSFRHGLLVSRLAHHRIIGRGHGARQPMNSRVGPSIVPGTAAPLLICINVKLVEFPVLLPGDWPPSPAVGDSWGPMSYNATARSEAPICPPLLAGTGGKTASPAALAAAAPLRSIEVQVPPYL